MNFQSSTKSDYVHIALTEVAVAMAQGLNVRGPFQMAVTSQGGETRHKTFH